MQQCIKVSKNIHTYNNKITLYISFSKTYMNVQENIIILGITLLLLLQGK